MTAGFALLADPVGYYDSGAMSFLDDQNGQIYQYDFGADTGQLATGIAAHNSNSTRRANNAATLGAQTQKKTLPLMRFGT